MQGNFTSYNLTRPTSYFNANDYLLKLIIDIVDSVQICHQGKDSKIVNICCFKQFNNVTTMSFYAMNHNLKLLTNNLDFLI